MQSNTITQEKLKNLGLDDQDYGLDEKGDKIKISPEDDPMVVMCHKEDVKEKDVENIAKQYNMEFSKNITKEDLYDKIDNYEGDYKTGNTKMKDLRREYMLNEYLDR
jgi:hypothetical protein